MKEKLEDIWEHIGDFIFSIKSEFHFHIERIIGCWEYLCFIWTHNSYREWDYEYLYELIIFKLERMAKQLKKDDFVESSEKTYKEIMKTINYYQVYTDIEVGYTPKCLSNKPLDYHKLNTYQNIVWDKFHNSLRDNSRKWWS